jgi:transcriptional regulator NrdR family protein
MLCPECNPKKVKLKIVDSRPGRNNSRHRKYKCPKCGHEDYTTETMPVSRVDLFPVPH